MLSVHGLLVHGTKNENMAVADPGFPKGGMGPLGEVWTSDMGTFQ